MNVKTITEVKQK